MAPTTTEPTTIAPTMAPTSAPVAAPTTTPTAEPTTAAPTTATPTTTAPTTTTTPEPTADMGYWMIDGEAAGWSVTASPEAYYNCATYNICDPDHAVDGTYDSLTGNAFVFQTPW